MLECFVESPDAAEPGCEGDFRHGHLGFVDELLGKEDAAGLRDAILNNKLSPITYNAPKPKEITDEDKVIEAYKIVVKPVEVVIVPVDKVFQ